MKSGAAGRLPAVLAGVLLLIASAVLEAQAVHRGGTLDVLTLNIAHGRGDALNQLLVGEVRARDNLAAIATLVRDSGVQVAALQEADAPSAWSRNLDQVTLLARQSGLSGVIHGRHARSRLYDYGTALLSSVPFEETLTHTFKPSPPTTNKGFTLGMLHWQPDPDRRPVNIDVTSTHLDFSRDQVRRDQIEELHQVLSRRNNPLILMGDFNSEWADADSIVQELSVTLDLHVYRPHAKDLATYPGRGKRLDWIMLSRELAFVEYRNLPQQVSDHLAVLARIKLLDVLPDS